MAIHGSDQPPTANISTDPKTESRRIPFFYFPSRVKTRRGRRPRKNGAAALAAAPLILLIVANRIPDNYFLFLSEM